MISNFQDFGDPSITLHHAILTRPSELRQANHRFSPLTDIIQSLENFQDFQPEVRAAAIALRASELSIPKTHFYMIALHAGLGGVR